MQIPIGEFEQHIDESILKRGLSYFEKGRVNEPVEIEQGVYQAIVEGTEDYTVRLTLKKGNIVEYVCDCPYDLGPVCKHIAALIFYLQQETLELPRNSPGSKKRGKAPGKTARKKSSAEQLKELLHKIPHEELKRFILEQSADSPSFRDRFLSSFAHLANNESKEFYASQVKSILRRAGDRDGFIDYQEAGRAGKDIGNLLIAAQKHIENKNYKSAVFICCAVMEEAVGALQYADDSNGAIGGTVEQAFEILYALPPADLPGEIRTFLLDYCLAAYDNRIFSDWDWHTGMADLASRLITSDEEAQNIILRLDKTGLSEYELEKAQLIRLAIIKKTKGEKEAQRFIGQHLSNPSFRRIAIEEAIKSKSYQSAITMAEEGIKKDARDKPGLALEWYDWLLRIYQAQRNKEKIAAYARHLFVANFRHEQDYYALMKSNIAPEDWNSFIEGVIHDIKSKSRWTDVSLIADIYIREEWWDRLLRLITEKPSLHQLEDYEKYLAKDHAAELVRLYEHCIVEYMKNSTGRNHYQTACRYIRRMIKLGAREKAGHVVELLRKQYPQRRALLEELERV